MHWQDVCRRYGCLRLGAPACPLAARSELPEQTRHNAALCPAAQWTGYATGAGTFALGLLFTAWKLLEVDLDASESFRLSTVGAILLAWAVATYARELKVMA